MCHLKEWKSWSQTKMAQAFEQLKPGERTEAKKTAGLDPDKDYTQDETCLFVGDDYVFDFEANKDKGTHEKFPLKYTH